MDEVLESRNQPLLRSIWTDFAGLGKLWPHLREHRRALYLALGLIPLISAFQVAVPFLLKWSIDSGIARGDRRVLTAGAVGFLTLVLLEYGARAVQRLATSTAVYRMVKGLRKTMVAHVLGLSAGYHDRTLSGTLVTRATSDFENLTESLNQGVLGSLIDMAVLVGSAVGLILLDWRLALSLLVILPLMGGVITWFSRALKRAMLVARQKIAVLNAFTQECLYGSATVKLLNAHRDATARYDRMCVEYRNAQMKSVVLDAMMFAVIDGMASITIGVVLWVAVSPWMSGAGITAGVLVAAVQYIHQLYEPLKNLGSKMAMLQGAFTAIDRIFGVLQVRDQVGGNQPVSRLQGDLRFEGVSFRYLKREGNRVVPGPRVLREVSFSLQPGQSLALVGPTGSGKSTIIKLLTKMYDGYEGVIRLDGQDLRDLDPVTLRRQMAIVPQDIVLFDGTVAFNIGLGRPGVSEAAVRHAAEVVGADRFIERLPGGYAFPIREQGGNLSHGQRQLLTFARALATEPRVVILDEATSSVDAQSEEMIQRAVDRMLRDRTVVVIAHRLSTIRRCDRILVVEKGRIVEQGTHGELLTRGGVYRELHESLAES